MSIRTNEVITNTAVRFQGQSERKTEKVSSQTLKSEFEEWTNTLNIGPAGPVS